LAARLFLARSYMAVGVNEICAAAAAPKSSFYHFFPAKADLAIAVVDHHATALWKRLDECERRRRGLANKIRATADVVGEVRGRLHQTFGRIVGCPLGRLAVELAPSRRRPGATSPRAWPGGRHGWRCIATTLTRSTCWSQPRTRTSWRIR
jgi:TetR/AcrR family transcriptional repressor of nem operon